jgi:hypothetical protein
VTIDRILQFLVEDLDSDRLDEKAKAYVDRLLLRLMTSPALMSFLEATQLLKEGNDYIVELLFRKVPEEQVDVIKQFIAEPNTSFSFEQKGQTHFAFRVKLTPKDLDDSSDSEQGPTTGVAA